jgi:membrane-bound lytic murein transglycosylase MltF
VKRSLGGLALFAALLVLPAACDRQPRSPDEKATATLATETDSLADAAASPVPGTAALPSDDAIGQMLAPHSGDLDSMIARRYIRVLVTLSKTNYFVDRGEQHGATYEAGKLFEEFLNRRLGSKHIRVALAFIPVARDRLIPALAEGRGDIAAAGLTITPERARVVDFAVPFANDVRELVVTAADQPALTDVQQLSGREVHVRRSSSYYGSLVHLNDALRAAGKSPARIVAASEQLEDEDLLEMVNAGIIPATIVDSYLAEFWSGAFDQIRVQRDAPVRTGRQIAWALRKNTPQLHEMVDAFVAAHGKGSASFNIVTQRYFKDNRWVKNPRSEAELRRFRETADLFRTYGDRYDLPWLLIAAQAFQESGIDQTKRSPAGAVGVMQIKPTTAEGKPIGINGVETSAERNIHAGVKYLRFIADRYYADQPMDRVNKGLFAMASYNAGPARIAQLRAKAARMGLDPNRWFGNVEIVAGREIGRETVQYVSNIYKYFVTYELLMAQRERRGQARESHTPKSTVPD